MDSAPRDPLPPSHLYLQSDTQLRTAGDANSNPVSHYLTRGANLGQLYVK